MRLAFLLFAPLSLLYPSFGHSAEAAGPAAPTAASPLSLDEALRLALAKNFVIEVARYEPRLALDGGPDGLAPYRTIAAVSPQLVTAAGHLVVEIGEGQAIEIARILRNAGLRTSAPIKDLGGIERVLRATH